VVDQSDDGISSLCNSLGGVCVLKKGGKDIISNGTVVLSSENPGSNRRCGGQGDVLAGSLGAILSWVHLYQNKRNSASEIPPVLVAAYGASMLVRECSKEAFSKHLRSTTTPDIINEIGPVFEKLFPCNC